MGSGSDVNMPPPNHVRVLDGQGWVGMVDHMGGETTIVNAARVSFGKVKDKIDDRDKGLIRYLIDNQHTSPLEHVAFTFVVHCPLFVRGQWHRHRTWKYNEISRRYTEINLEFYTPPQVREQALDNRQASIEPVRVDQDKAKALIAEQNTRSLALYETLIKMGVCREQARGVLPQNMFTTFWATVDLHNLMHFIALRDSEHAQWEIQQYAQAIKTLVAPIVPSVAEICGW